MRNHNWPRTPLNGREVSRALAAAGSWREIRVLAETGSTNADLLALARDGAEPGLVLAAESQTAGRGRLGRRWDAPSGTGLAFSVLLRPDGVPPASLGWLPLLAGVAVVRAVREAAVPGARLKWPNDILVGERKLAGILVETWGSAVVAGIGLNVSGRAGELPPGATSLAMEEAPPLARERLLVALLGELARWYGTWLRQDRPGDAAACGLHREYLRWSATVGRRVTVTLPPGRPVTGVAAGVDGTGRLEVRVSDRLLRLSAGDVVHLR